MTAAPGSPVSPGRPGWHLDGRTLLPVLDDVAAFRRAHADDPVVEALVALWSGDPHAAEAELRERLAERDSPRLRALLADAWRDQGRTREAVAAYEELVAESTGTSREAVMTQHWGKALFVAGRYAEALAAFERALRLREEGGADAALLDSSRAAVRRTRELLRSQHPSPRDP